ncbi:T9SS type A sorting domain-containing protein [Adhaeribacter sp. BT258]|uniref:T9SS type A sorting domain-containing protein n=1 Tax=Adhaeribacter terrigena TaxID=2793070 RepID=A0ABS1BXR6_9BACT|nr:T9SS type A sorting domain-containing protein [Adhaeribacter terrigena]MBK0401889.1 T9SS type A sorting domain-containing protein [Adhaeribacter terrigena]
MKKLILIACSLLAAYGSKAQDAGVNAISSPTSSVLSGVSQPVSVTLKNYTASALTSATLSFSVNGVVQPSFSWSGNIGANGTSASIAIGNFTFPAGSHKIKAWSKMPNGVTDTNAANDSASITIFSCSSLSGNYTINNNAAASATNFTSVSAAAQALALCGVNGPVTFTVAPNSGPYNGVVNLPVISGTNATNKVTFEGNGTIISGAGSQGLINFSGADYVKVNNFKINVDPASTTSSGVYFSNISENDIISNCTINLSVSSTGMNMSGIAAGNFSGNNVNNLLIENNIINGGNNGILLSGTGTNTGNQIIGNIVRDSRAYGIYIANGGSGTLIEGNDISRPTRVNTQGFYGITLQGTTINTIVNKNRIHNTHDVSSNPLSFVRAIHTTAAAPVGSENIIKNNLIYNITNNGGPLYALANEGGSGTYYYHNTVSADNPNIIYTTVSGLYIQLAASNLKFINNIVSLTTSSVVSHAIYLNSNAVSLVSNNNDLVVGGSGHIGYYPSVNFTTLADWRMANGGIYDQNSLSVDPLFVNATYLQPLALALNNAGQSLPAVTDAINGVTRSTTTPDMGAYEFTPVANDAGVTAINAPTSPVTPGSQPVSFTLKNFGTATLTSATIGWSVNNVAQTPYSWTGSLNSLQATATPVTIGNYTFPTGNLTLKVWSQNPNGVADGLTANDTTVLNIVSCAPLAGNYTINKNNPTAGTNYQSFAEVVQKLNTCGVSGPVTITVASGTGPYNEQVEIMNIPYTSATNTVTFEGSGNTVSATPVAKLGIIVLNGAKFVKVNNFVITAPTGVTSVMGIQLLNSANNNTISNNTVNLPATGSVSNVSGIVAGASLFDKGNNTSFTKIQNNIIYGGGIGIKILGNTEGVHAVNNQITGNQVRDSYYTGISINDANGTLVEGNDISRPTLTASGNFTAIELFAVTRNSIISRNRIHNTHDMIPTTTSYVYGISVNNAASTPGNENIIKNNLIYKVNIKGGNFIGLYNSGSNGAYFDHNTVATDPADNYNTVNAVYFGGNISNVKFRNNIISLLGPATNTNFAIHVSSAGISLESNNNDLYVSFGGFIGYFNGVPKLTLADWKTTNLNAYDQNSVSINPVFTNFATGDLKPTAATLDNLGQPIANVTDDFLGISRNVTTPDMGAYEFVTIGNDVGIVAVSGPSITGCGLSATDSITVTIKNFGTITQTSIPVSYSVNGVDIPAPETFIGSIASNATATYTFSTKANLATAGNYQITATTQLVGDNIVNNNPNTLYLTNTLLPNLPVVFDFETQASGIAGMRKVVNSNSSIVGDPAASFGTGSTKGMIMDGVDHAGWVAPTGTTDPWTTNPDNFAAVSFCIPTGSGAATDSLKLTFDLKQLFKTAIENTNLRVTVNGAQVGPTYRPVSGTNNWQKIKVNLSSYLNTGSILIGLESSVKEAYDSGNGTANLIDNINVSRVSGVTGVKDYLLQSLVNVYPNPSNGIFNIELPKGKAYELEVTDLTGKVLKKLNAKGGSNQLNLEGKATGIYLLKVSGDNGSAVRKLIVE